MSDDNDKISVFGAGFIGGRFVGLNKKDCIVIERNSVVPESGNILYLISTTDNYNVFTDPHKDIDTNLNHLISVLQNCKPGDTFNFVSSWFVYGEVNLPVRETAYCNPKGFYSITKRAAEQLLISYCETFKINYRIFRLCNVLGKSDLHVSKKKNALQYLIGKLKNNEDIELYFKGDFYRDYMYVDDVCNAIKHCMDNSSQNEIINIGSGKKVKFYDLIEYCKTKLNSNSKISSMDQPEFHKLAQVRDMYLDVSKLSGFGFVPDFDIWKTLDILCDVKE